MELGQGFITDTIKRLLYYKSLGDKTFEQLTDADFLFQPAGESNSIAVIIQHLHGNMLSRWTDFLTTDGEKEWRLRDAEFTETILSKHDLLKLWEAGWNCFVGALQSLQPVDLTKQVTIRSEALYVYDAIIRQTAHYPYHVGQIVYLGRLIKNENWQNLSIPKGESQQFNAKMQGK